MDENKKKDTNSIGVIEGMYLFTLVQICTSFERNVVITVKPV